MKALAILCVVGTVCALVALPIFVLTLNSIQWLIDNEPVFSIIVLLCFGFGIVTIQSRMEHRHEAHIDIEELNTNINQNKAA